MKRFYESVTLVEVEQGFAVTLDGKAVRTPAGNPLRLPNRPLAEAVAEEWRRQEADIDAAAMGLTRLANTAIDLVAMRRDNIIAEAAVFAGTDLICYRVDGQPALSQRQEECWQPLVEWAAERFGAELAVTTGIAPVEQPPGVLKAISAAIGSYPDFPLTALHAVTAACGSVVIALALAEDRLDADAAWQAAHLDEDFQAGRWGDDPEQRERLDAVRRDIADAGLLLQLCRAAG